jgi:uncharacterized protein (TIGR03437 family)
LNQDTSLNSAARPAEQGEIVALFATGAGVTSPAVESGKPAEAPYPAPAGTVALAIGGRPAEILFAGLAPGLVGLLQVNARVPEGVRGLAPVTLTIAGQSSRGGVTVWVR